MEEDKGFVKQECCSGSVLQRKRLSPFQGSILCLMKTELHLGASVPGPTGIRMSLCQGLFRGRKQRQGYS